MPVAKTPSKARRTRKATTKSVAAVTTTKYTQPVVNKMTETPVKSRPSQPNISLNDYVADAKVRWEIHQWETKELWNDCKWGYNQLKPIVLQVVDYCTKSYNKAFNKGQ